MSDLFTQIFGGGGGNRPTDSYGGWLQNQENQANDQYSFISKWYQTFNPQAPQMNTPSSAPLFNKTTADVHSLADRLKGNGNPGTFNMGTMDTNQANQAGNLTAQRDLSTSLSDMNKNAAEGQKYGGTAFGRMSDIANKQADVNEMPTIGAGMQANTLDTVNQMWNNYDNQNNWQNVLGNVLGGFGGTLAGDKLFGSNDTPQTPAYPQNANLPPEVLYPLSSLPGGTP